MRAHPPQEDFHMRLGHYVASLMMIVAISACSAISNYPPPEENAQPAPAASVSTITAQKIVLVDANGHERGQLGVAPGGVGLALSDGTGKPRIALIVDETDHPGLTLYSPNGVPRASLQLSQNGDSGVALYDDAGRCHVAMAVSSTGVPSITLFDQAGNVERPASPAAPASEVRPATSRKK
jgi:hypothetical protein